MVSLLSSVRRTLNWRLERQVSLELRGDGSIWGRFAIKVCWPSAPSTGFYCCTGSSRNRAQALNVKFGLGCLPSREGTGRRREHSNARLTFETALLDKIRGGGQELHAIQGGLQVAEHNHGSH